jgi:hypothetical protein
MRRATPRPAWADVIVGRNLHDPKQSSAIRVAMPLLQMPLMRQNDSLCMGQQGKRRKPDISRRARRGAELVRKAAVGRPQPANSSSNLSMPQGSHLKIRAKNLP